MDTGLPRSAAAFLLAAGGVATAAAAPAVAQLGSESGDWLAFAVLAAGAAVAQLFTFEVGRNHGFPTAIVFVVAAAILLPPGLVALVALATYAPDLLTRRYPWYVSAFNAANLTLNGLAGWAAASALGGVSGGAGGASVAALAGAVAFVATNHLLLAVMLRLARGHSFGDSGLFSAESVSIDLGLALAGLVLAAVVAANAVLVVTFALPLVLAHQLLKLVVGELEADEKPAASEHAA